MRTEALEKFTLLGSEKLRQKVASEKTEQE